ncbi:hypothetical protein BC834DRAFT_655545 [Gloeopeniophorella convolvens]|nr:hypothetical protein BC834DRAFT_655545 [Gloeopeniophorella convolvens]
MPSRDGFFSSRASAKDGLHLDSLDDSHQRDTADRPFTSAIEASPSRPTVLRRRGSDGGSSGPWSTLKQSLHSRSRTVDSSSNIHPLRRSSTTRTARYDKGSTRPRLTRMLSSTLPLRAEPDPPSDGAEPHRIVLEHEVSPSDSLAGVALKYGISLTELRRANQLWASDSIHLRQVLYIPLDKARHTSLETVASSLAQRAEPEPTSDTSTSKPESSKLERSSNVKRVPTTSLSFFPPSSNPGAYPRTVSSPLPFKDNPYSISAPSTPPRRSNQLSSIGANALSSLFSALPLNASTRDELISRLSMESASTSTTGTASDEVEHELTTVPTTPKSRTNASALIPVPFISPQRSGPSRTKSSDSGVLSGREPPERSVEQIALSSTPIHTVQMQPAAIMQLPEHMARSPSKGSSGNLSRNSAWFPSNDRPPVR